jgi:hypothetical protein
MALMMPVLKNEIAQNNSAKSQLCAGVSPNNGPTNLDEEFQCRAHQNRNRHRATGNIESKRDRALPQAKVLHRKKVLDAAAITVSRLALNPTASRALQKLPLLAAQGRYRV